MDAERLSQWKNKVTDFNDASNLAYWKSLFTGLAELYKDELAETTSGVGTGQPLTVARAAVDSALATFLAALTADTSQVKK